jgi:hypothetical protein
MIDYLFINTLSLADFNMLQGMVELFLNNSPKTQATLNGKLLPQSPHVLFVNIEVLVNS